MSRESDLRCLQGTLPRRRIGARHLRTAVSGPRTDVVKDLNRLMAEETEAFLRYFQMRFRVHGRGRRAAEKFFAEALPGNAATRRSPCSTDPIALPRADPPSRSRTGRRPNRCRRSAG